MTIHARDRLRERFGLECATVEDVHDAIRVIKHGRAELVASSAKGSELYRLTVRGVEMIAVYYRATNSIATFVPLPVEGERRPKTRTPSVGRILETRGNSRRAQLRLLRNLQREEDADDDR